MSHAASLPRTRRRRPLSPLGWLFLVWATIATLHVGICLAFYATEEAIGWRAYLLVFAAFSAVLGSLLWRLFLSEWRRR